MIDWQIPLKINFLGSKVIRRGSTHESFPHEGLALEAIRERLFQKKNMKKEKIHKKDVETYSQKLT